MTTSDWLDRAKAFEEAVEHLGMEWADTDGERAQGKIAARKIKKLADRCYQIAASGTPAATPPAEGDDG